MRIFSVEAVNSQNKEKYTFEFDRLNVEGKKLVTTKGSKLDKYLEFCFTDAENCPDDVTVKFSIDDEIYHLSKVHSDTDTIKTSLRKEIGTKKTVVARGKNVAPYIASLTNENIEEILKLDFVSDKIVEGFHGDLKQFHDVRVLLDISDNVEQTNRQLQEKNRLSNETLRQLSEEKDSGISKQQVEEVSNELSAVSLEINNLTGELTELKSRKASGVITGEILTELSNAQSKHQQLVEQKPEIDQLREQLAQRDSISAIVPKVTQLETLAKQRADYEKRRYAAASEVEWQENELSNVIYQLDEKQRQSTGVFEKRSKIEVINQELQSIAELYSRNKELNEQLVKLTEQSDRIDAERVLYKNKTVSIENKIKDIKNDIEKFKVPNQTLSELLETVRIDVKIDEVQAQIDKLKSEIAIKESQIAEKESTLVLQVKKFKSVAELDVTVAPIKAKDTILQVLDAKNRKLELINNQLAEKQRNFQRSYEDSKYRILQVEHSLTCLNGDLEKTVLRKQEEFKREVFLNSQKVYTDDATSIFAVTTRFDDEEISTFKQEIATREAERDQLLQNSAELKGKIDEIERQMVINSAEIATLQQERNNINKRYNEIVSQNRNETVFNYLKALESNNGTRYLLDVQQDAVRNEAELSENKQTLDGLRSRLASLQARLRYLTETQKSLDTTQNSVEQLVASNDHVKDGLSNIGEALLANYEQYHAVSEQLKNAEERFNNIQQDIVEVTKSVKVNENQIALSTEKAKRYAGGDDLEQAITNFRYEIADIDSEKQMLAESKLVVEKGVFKKRLELEKLQYMYESKNAEYNELLETVQFELNLHGIDIATINSYHFTEDTEEIRKKVQEYDQSLITLAERIESYYAILKSQNEENTEDETKLNQRILDLQNKINVLKRKESDLERQRQTTMSMYLASNNSKIKLAIVASEAKTLAELKQTIRQNEIVDLLVSDKINSILTSARNTLQAISDQKFKLEAIRGDLVIRQNGKTVSYDDLPIESKYCIYLSLLLGIGRRNAQNTCLVFEEKPAIAKETLAKMLSKLNDVYSVVSYNRKVATTKTEEKPDTEDNSEAEQNVDTEQTEEQKTTVKA